ncbi:phosphogluconate dehydrogenase (NADP(+)-dependent, decarboxylating) [Algibacter marinivivus]|uniref:6-phosphogluconate dehydrogenase, decarboxylating n=2 Tax=Algibacter marinivivus TaxID=2100723 RepID=A0A2U2X308_9FLAO|nr:phosphogluconate dehydrogenase (NADP(+)-dependent, decarboxylating) [Algibacter marinivivus]
MGVSGVGKSTIGQLLADEMNLPFFDGDNYHSKHNVEKMSSGESLNDDDRHGWLSTLNQLIKEQLKNNSCILVCSALKNKYRELLSDGILNEIEWIYLFGDFDTIYNRINKRKNHFMPSELLKSQFDTLEKPTNAITCNIDNSPKEIIENIKKELMKKSEFGLLGLGVMGKSLCINLSNNGFKISMYNRHVDGVEEHVALKFKKKHTELSSALPFDNLEEFVNSIQKPRKIMFMVNAGKTIDAVIENILPYLSEGDIIIDGGNSNYNSTKERFEYLKSKNIHFIGAGVSGGEEGALKGPSIMPSGSREAYKSVQPFLESIASHDRNGLPCCAYIGPEGSGHFVKMIHNGIEYVEMQLLAEVFSIFKATRKTPDEIAEVLEIWKKDVDSYLLNITIDILRKKENNDWLINNILDKAGNKGTGNWATIATAELGIPSTLIASSLFARYTSSFKEDRIKANISFGNNDSSNIKIDLIDLLNAYQFARIINHYQGFKLIEEASKFHKWNLNLSEIARIWTSGCIIKSDLMAVLVEVFKKSKSILINESIKQQLQVLRPSANKLVSQCILNEIAIPCLSESVNFLNTYTTADSSANLIQAQRDYFGAHTYQRTDDDSGKFYHTNWKN